MPSRPTVTASPFTFITAGSPPHAFDYEAILCACGSCLGFRPARTKDQLRCALCGVAFEPKPRAAAPLPPAAQAIVDTFDHARARAELNSFGCYLVPASLWEAMVAARAGLP